VQPFETPSRKLPVSDSQPLERRSMLWSIMGLGMLLVIAAIGGWTLHEVANSDYWVDHTREVMHVNEELLSAVKDAESAERGYIITGDDNYLEPYRTASAEILPTEQKLTQLTGDNRPQQDRISHLKELIDRRIAVFNDAVDQRKESGFTAAETVVVSGRGRAMMKEIRDTSEEITAEEERLLQERVQKRQSRMRNGFVTGVVATLVALLALIFAPIDVRQAVKQRDAAEQEKQESAATARALFEAAAQAIFVVDRKGHIVMMNPATEKMLGYEESELLGQAVEVLVPEALRGGHVGHRSGYFRNPQTRPMGHGLDLQARAKDGTILDVEISLSYIQSAGETLAVAFMSDISKRKGDEQAIRRQREDLRTLAGRLMTAQDDERRRIARDLHDDLSQKLAYLAMDLGKLASKAESKELLDRAQALQRRAAEAAETVRHISHQLHPSILDDIGLEAALEQCSEEFEERSGIRTHFLSRDVPDSIPRDVASSMYHIFQESLRNVSKHSEAEEVFVTLESVDSVLRLNVRDEGVGLPPHRLQAAATGIGIVGMKERAHLVNGTVSIDSKHGEGTEVTVSVPLSNAG